MSGEASSGRRRSARSTVVRLAASAGMIVATAGSSILVGASPSGAATPGRYIVSAADEASAARAVQGVGGTVLAELPIVAAVDARLDAAGVQALSSEHSVSLTPDVTMRPLGQSYNASTLAPQLARMDLGANWSPRAGTGVGVALIDTGVSNTPGIDPSHIVRSPDFSGSGDPYDGYGHGTFMAGLIVGNGAGGSGGVPGVAPGATLVAVKVAGDAGTTTLAQVIMGIGWAIANRNTYNIKVMSLSFGADFSMAPAANPLDLAVEAAWDSGIAVVASSGNEGAGHVTSPGDDPAIISVGAETTVGPVQSPTWSGTTTTKPDVLAPGVSVVSLRDPGSVVDVQNPSARIGDSYFVGSGTSMSTALTAGAAALLVADHPSATPSQVKAALVATSGPDLSGPAGPIDVSAADATSPSSSGSPGRAAPAGRLWSTPGLPAQVSMDTLHWDTLHWDTLHWDTLHWDTFHWDGSAWTGQTWGQ